MSQVTERIPSASIKDSIATIARVVAPTLSKGVIIRRPRVVGMAETLGLDDRAVNHMQRLNERYGDGPLMIRMPGPPRAVLLAPEDVKQVLNNSPEPFAAAQTEKRSVLSHFEPKNALITHGPPRAPRRTFNESVLKTDQRVHPMAESLRERIESEMAELNADAEAKGALDWERFNLAWHRLVRCLILGGGAREDDELTDMLAELRSRANWAYLRPKDTALRDKFHERLNLHLERAEPESLASIVASMPRHQDVAPSHQIAQWFFAFDPGGMATFRALALLATHDRERERAASEIDDGALDKPMLRAALMESLRLWPTTPAILRETTREVEWRNGIMPKGTSVLIFAPYFHRDERRLPFAHRFDPEVWMGERAPDEWPLVPFSGGPVKCPAHNFVPLVASNALAAILRGRSVRLSDPERLRPEERLPGTLDNYTLRFEVLRH